MGLFVIGVVCVLGSVGGLECGGSWVMFVLTMVVGLLAIARGLVKMFS